MVKRVLVAFDFDHTLIDDNSDLYVLRLLPIDGQLPLSIQNLYSTTGWIDYQREVFRYLHLNHVTKEQLLACVTEIPLVEGMHELLEYLATSKVTAAKADMNSFGPNPPESSLPEVGKEVESHAGLADNAVCAMQQQNSVTEIARTVQRAEVDGFSESAALTLAAGHHSLMGGNYPSDSAVQFDAIIVSDANSTFIDHILERAGLRSVFSKVYTNPASFDNSGCLHLSPYHRQDWCTMSSANMCKGHILDEHCQKSDVKYDVIAYVGDGGHDFCPTLRLQATDVVFPRRRFSLEKHIANGRDKVAARVACWDTGFDIMSVLKEVVMNAEV